MKDIIHKCLPTYKVGEKLGEGIYGSVYMVNDGLKERAVKIVPLFVEKSVDLPGPQALDSKVSRDFLAVQEYYGKIKGEGVVEIYDFHLVNKRVARDHAAAELVILMEYCPDNLSSAVVDNFPLDQSLCISCMFQLASLLRRLCRVSAGVFVISDLKPTNILVTVDGNLVIGDLGGLKRVNSLSATMAAQFSPSWTAPEIILKGEAPGISSTVYAYGLVSYFIWEGKQPYPEADFISRISLVRDKGAEFKRPDIPSEIKALISKCLSFNPKDRPWDFDEILSRLSEVKAGLLRSSSPKVSPFLQKRDGSHAMGMSASMDGRPDNSSPGHVDTSVPYFDNERLRNVRPGDVWREPYLAMEFVWVSSGYCVFGEARESREVTGFWISKYPVTQGQWKKMMNYNPSHFSKGDNYPVERVSWNEAQSFVTNLNQKHAQRYVFSLPTELQWEYAARGGNDSLADYAGAKNHDDVAWHRFNSDLSTQPVGRKKPNELGIYDMCGNVMEWCEDCFNANDADLGSSRDIYRISKGGSWKNDPAACRISSRHRATAGLGYSDLGFRIVRII